MSTFCPVTRDLNEYLSVLDSSEAKDEAIAEEAARLMETGQDYYPWTAENISEALAEISRENLEKIAAHFAQKSVSLAGGSLYYLIQIYWQDAAKKKAEETVLASWSERQQPDPDDRRDYERDDAYEPGDPKRSDFLGDE